MCEIMIRINYKLLFSDGYTYDEEDIPEYLYYVFGEWSGKEFEQMKRDIKSIQSCSFYFKINEHASFRDLVDDLLDILHFDKAKFYMCYSPVYVKESNELVNIQNYEFLLKDFIELYDIQESINLFFIFSRYQGDVYRKDGIRYYMQSKEQGHNKPHLHVNVNKEYSASIDINTGELLAGDLPTKEYNKVRRYIEKNKETLLDYWNKNTNGLNVDINYSCAMI